MAESPSHGLCVVFMHLFLSYQGHGNMALTPAVEYKLFMATGLIGLKKTILFSSKQKPFGDTVVSQAVI